MRARLGVAVGALGFAGGLIARALRRQRAKDVAAEADPRATELRQKLAESRAMAEEREEFEAAEVPVDRAEPVPDVDERRREVHRAARSAVDEMRGTEQ